MRIRQFIAAMMILLSLSAQARSALACGMTPGTPLAACCCPGDSQDQPSAAAATQHCCDQVAPADAPLAHASAASKHQAPANLDHPQPLAAMQAWLLPSSFDSGGGTPTPGGDDHRRVRPLYLQTARLRL